jgi:hypothetical protein
MQTSTFSLHKMRQQPSINDVTVFNKDRHTTKVKIKQDWQETYFKIGVRTGFKPGLLGIAKNIY